MSDIPANQKAVLELNDKMVQEISYGVHRTLSSVFGLNPIVGKHYLAEDLASQGDISGFVTLTQERVEGALIVTFPQATIFGVLSRLYRKQFTEIDKSVRQGVGEMTNMVFGVFKTNLVNYGYSFKMMIPSVVVGEAHKVAIYMPGKTLVIPFETEVGSFKVMLLLYPEEAVKFNVAG